MQSLKGKFVIRNDENGYRTGQVEDVSDEVVLIRFDNMRPEASDPPFVFPMELVCFPELSCATVTDEDPIKTWGFFPTRADLDGFLAFLEKPKPDVVKLVPRKKR